MATKTDNRKVLEPLAGIIAYSDENVEMVVPSVGPKRLVIRHKTHQLEMEIKWDEGEVKASADLGAGEGRKTIFMEERRPTLAVSNKW